ncbi:MAG: recombinase family protein [Nitrospirae bacterium]|nr:recombinase family protein [Nitrospirota bacterium]
MHVQVGFSALAAERTYKLKLPKGCVYGYIRVSSEEQVQGHSIESQISHITKYCKSHGFKLEKIYRDEGYTGKEFYKRVGIRQLIKELSFNDKLVVFAIDRLSRDLLALLVFDRFLLSKNIELHVTSTGRVDTSMPETFLTYCIQALMADVEGKQISKRTKASMSLMKEKSSVVGSIPLGYRKEGDKLVLDDDEQAVIRKATRLYEDGFTLAMIVRALDEEGLKNRVGKPWDHRQLPSMIDGYEPSRRRTLKSKGWLGVLKQL